MKPFNRILKSLSARETLNPKVWDLKKSKQKPKIRSKIRKGLLTISEEFIESLDYEVFIEDITLTGSLSNYNWSKFSDFDLHILIDFDQFEEDAELYKELFDLRKSIFNDKHDIKIYGYDVEIYVQDSKEEHYSSGIYSIFNNEWIIPPKKYNTEIDEKILSKKIKCWVEKIENAIETESINDDKKVLETLKEKLKEYRQSGLKKKGELSYENLVFKFLRRSGHVEKLFDSLNKSLDKELSIETTNNND